MKQYKTLLLLLFVALYSAGQGVPKGIPQKTKIGIPKGNDVLLVYTGSLTSPVTNISIGMRLEIDSSIGVRYEVVFERGSSVLSHIAIFYKFSKPNQSVYYNYLTHKSMISTGSGETNDPEVTVVGKSVIGSYSCTHLQYKNDNETDDYWMSKQVPGFLKLMNILKNISPDLAGIAINGSVFQWGGAVKFTHNFVDQESGKKVNANLQLAEANSTMSFPASDFDIPSK
jgi:hypothetical protein